MPNKTFYLTRENFERIKKEPNQSKLLNGLLAEHYDTLAKPVATAAVCAGHPADPTYCGRTGCPYL